MRYQYNEPRKNLAEAPRKTYSRAEPWNESFDYEHEQEQEHDFSSTTEPLSTQRTAPIPPHPVQPPEPRNPQLATQCR